MLLLITLMMTWRGNECVPKSSPPRLSAATPCGPCVCLDSGLTVDCSSRSLTAVPDPSLLPAQATALLLNNNSIAVLQPSGFKAFPSLLHLDVSGNLLTNLTAYVFDGLCKLLTLKLTHNHLSIDFLSPSEKPFLFLTSLKQLNLAYNWLSDVSKGWGLPGHSLRWLDLSHNSIIRSNESFTLNELTNLTVLNLSDNHINSLSGLFLGMKNLQKLDLRHNKIPLTHEAYPLQAFEPFQSTMLELSLEGNCKVDTVNHSLDYPDRALAQLKNLLFLSMDGLPHTAFGPGFRSLTSLTTLNVTGTEGYCSMNTVSNDTFLSMPASLRQLNISGCNISFIDTDAFRPLRNMEVLDLSFNPDLGFDTLGDAFYSLQGSALHALHINSIIRPYTMCVMVTAWNTRYFRNTSLHDIHAKNNRLQAFCQGALNNMPDTLRFVSIDENELGFGSYFKDLDSLKNLEWIHNDGHRLAFDPPREYPRDSLERCQPPSSEASGSQHQCRRSWRPDDSTEAVWTPAVEGFHHQGTSPQHTGKLIFTLPPKLNSYVSRWDKLYYKILDVEFNPNNSLTILSLSNNLITTWIGPITGLNKLVVLDIANNFAYNVSATFFDTLSSLKMLNASRNNLREFIRRDVHGRWFEPLNQLEELCLLRNYINIIPKNLFKGLVNLQKLDLSHNEIFVFDTNITFMQNITLLDLSYNNIHFLPQFIRDHLDMVAQTTQHNVTVDMTFNPIACTCEHIDFLTWIQTSQVLFPGGNNYSCLMADGSIHHLADIFQVTKQLQDTCINKSGILIGAVSCFICLIMVLSAALIYRYRWKLRYLYYASRLFYNRVESRDDDFPYDAFVSYSSEDNQFVHGKLLEELETKAGLTLNIHNRDFMPGQPIPSNIVDAVQKSRHTLVVLSRDLLQSDWCHYELQMATMEASHTGRDVLIFLLYEDVPSHELPREVFYNLQASTYISFPSHADPPLLRDFWARLVQAIRQ